MGLPRMPCGILAMTEFFTAAFLQFFDFVQPDRGGGVAGNPPVSRGVVGKGADLYPVGHKARLELLVE